MMEPGTMTILYQIWAKLQISEARSTALHSLSVQLGPDCSTISQILMLSHRMSLRKDQ